MKSLHDKMLARLHKPGCDGFYGPCNNPQAEWRRMGTAYVNVKDNYRFLCDECYQDGCEYWKDAWDEYYAQVL